MTRAQTRFARRLVKYIIAEPKHVHMSYFAIDLERGWAASVRASGNPNSIFNAQLGEVCGTAGCIAGSACLLQHGAAWREIHIEHSARVALGLTPGQASALFYFPFEKPAGTTRAEWALYRDERRALRSLTPGIQEYANVVADAVQKTIDAYGFKGRL